MKTPEFINKIDWSDLRTQKGLLLETINNDAIDPEHKDALQGILHLIDALQDYAVDEMGIDEMHIFYFEVEEERDKETPEEKIIKEQASDNTKFYVLCNNCGSDNVEIKQWVNPNTGLIGDITSDNDDEDVWCNDCETHSGVCGNTLKDDAKIIGYQVVGKEDTEFNGEIHPHMDASFCIYSLSQARVMLMDDDDNWRLLAIWEGDIEDPTFMFSGNPRT